MSRAERAGECPDPSPRQVRRRPGAAGRVARFALSHWLLISAILSAPALGQSYIFTTLAGLPIDASPGRADGAGSDARFNYPSGVAVDDAGNVYVADSGNALVRKISPNGVVTTLAGSGTFGSADGTGSSAQFGFPAGIAVDTEGVVYIADSTLGSIRRITPAGVVTTLAGATSQYSYGSTDGAGQNAKFNGPSGVAVDASGLVYVADSNNHTIRKVTKAGVVTTLAGLAGVRGSADGTGSNARFNLPTELSIDSVGNVYVADTGNGAIRKISPTGEVLTLARIPLRFSYPGSNPALAYYEGLTGVTVSRTGNIFAVDHTSGTILSVAANGVVTTLAGLADRVGNADGIGSNARFSAPTHIAVDSAGILYVADRDNATIRRVDPRGVVTTLAGLANSFGVADGQGTKARFTSPCAVALDAAGNVYVADHAGVRKVTPAGLVSTVFDSGSDGFSPSGLAVDGAGNMYVTLGSEIAKISPGGTLTTFAGGYYLSGSQDGPVGKAEFNYPWGLVLDGGGNLLVADMGNRTIRKITPRGIVTTIAGTPGKEGSTDGIGSSARFFIPEGIAVDAAGNIFVADSGNDTIRRISPDGMVTTLAGLASIDGGADGLGSAARFNSPAGLTVDGGGNLLVADYYSDTIRRVTPAGVVTTVAGFARRGGSNDGTGFDARFRGPASLALDAAGILYVADQGNNTIRKGLLTADSSFLAIVDPPANQQVRANRQVTLSVAAASSSSPLNFQWKKDGVPLPGATTPSYTIKNATPADMGFYSVVVTSAAQSTESSVAVTVASGGTSRLANASTLSFMPPGGEVTTGLVVRGLGHVSLLVRVVGPGLIPLGLFPVLADPTLALAPSDGRPSVVANDNWGGGSELAWAFSAVGAFSFPALSRDAAALAALSPQISSSYTLRATSSAANDAGAVLSEIYDRGNSDGRLVNVSGRGLIGRGLNSLVLGFVISGTAPKTLLIRAVGPGLAQFGIMDFLADPQLTVVPVGRSFNVASNDDWTPTAVPVTLITATPPILLPGPIPVTLPLTDTIALIGLPEAFVQAGAFPLAYGSKDSAVVVSLPPGGYTVTALGMNNTSGLALVEIYDLDP